MFLIHKSLYPCKKYFIISSFFSLYGLSNHFRIYFINLKLILVSSSINSYINNNYNKSQKCIFHFNINTKKKNEKKCTISEFLDRNTKQIEIQYYSWILQRMHTRIILLHSNLNLNSLRSTLIILGQMVQFFGSLYQTWQSQPHLSPQKTKLYLSISVKHCKKCLGTYYISVIEMGLPLDITCKCMIKLL